MALSSPLPSQISVCIKVLNRICNDKETKSGSDTFERKKKEDQKKVKLLARPFHPLSQSD